MIRKNLISVSIAFVILYLSLTSSDTFNTVTFFNFPFIDKIVHFGMYFVLTTSILFENRSSVKRVSQFIIIGIIPFIYGVIMELFQLAFASSRSASILDALANLTGVIVALLIWKWIKPFKKDLLR